MSMRPRVNLWRGGRAAALTRLPEEIVAWEILIRLPARDILRCRVVCRSWLRLASTPDFLLAHHRRQPSHPLAELSSAASTNTEAGLPILEPRTILRFNDYDDYHGFKLQASCDGLLLLRRSGGRFTICNAGTRQRAPLPGLSAEGHIKILALYLHHPSKKYRVLYWKGRNHDEAVACYILTVWQRGSPRCIGVPSSNLAIEKAMMAGNGVTPFKVSPPVVFGNWLHREPGWLYYDVGGIVVFDTLVESFRSMGCPPGATSCCTRLCDMDGLIGFSCFDDGRTVAKIWLLEDYKREVWSFKYRVKFPVESLCHHTDTQHLILSHRGDVLVYNSSACYMFHCDSTGKLLEEFHWNNTRSQGWSIIGHRIKESLVQQEFFARRGAPSADNQVFFQRI